MHINMGLYFGAMMGSYVEFIHVFSHIQRTTLRSEPSIHYGEAVYLMDD